MSLKRRYEGYWLTVTKKLKPMVVTVGIVKALKAVILFIKAIMILLYAWFSNGKG